VHKLITALKRSQKENTPALNLTKLAKL